MAIDIEKLKAGALKDKNRETPRIAMEMTSKNNLDVSMDGDWQRVLRASCDSTRASFA